MYPVILAVTDVSTRMYWAAVSNSIASSRDGVSYSPLHREGLPSHFSVASTLQVGACRVLTFRSLMILYDNTMTQGLLTQAAKRDGRGGRQLI